MIEFLCDFNEMTMFPKLNVAGSNLVSRFKKEQ